MTVTNTTSTNADDQNGAAQSYDEEHRAAKEAFARAREGLDTYGASVSERELVDVLARHGEEEGHMLATYARFASSAPSATARYLVSLILDDERRHHRLLGEIANAVGWSWEAGRPGSAPEIEIGRHEPNEALIKETRELLREEEKDKKELRKLRRKLEPYADTTVWALLVDLMIHDTEKHARILRFILDHEG